MPENISSLIRQKKIIMNLYTTPDLLMGVTNPGDEEVVREKLRKI
ncbi:MAG: hypothetical protein AABW47_05055 [Nanoarchaeota archaeon]